jgi:hypothetical protein
MACDVNAKDCPGQELNLHEISLTSPSSWRVCQFRHPGETINYRRLIIDYLLLNVKREKHGITRY